VDGLTTQLAQKATQTDLNTTNTNVALKADKSYVDTQITSVGNGSPKGTYATLSALQTAFPTGTTGIYIVTADGGWYYWNGSAWTKGGTYQSTGIADGSITAKNTAFMSASKNLFNTYFEQGSMDGSGNTSNDASTSNTRTHDFINVSASTTYTLSMVKAVAFNIYLYEYDVNGVFIKVGNATTTNPYTFTTSSTTAKIKFLIYLGGTTIANLTPTNVQLEVGSTATNYISPLTIDPKYINNGTITPDKLSVNLKNYPFHSQASVPSELINAIKEIKLFGANPNKVYSLGYFFRNNAGRWLVRISETSVGSSVTNGTSVCALDQTNYTESSLVPLSDLYGTGVTGYAIIDWSQLSANALYSNQGYNQTGIAKATYMNTYATISPAYITNSMVANGAINGFKTSFNHTSKNLYNLLTATDNIVLDYTTGQQSSNTAFSTSDYIPVAASTSYIKNSQAHIIFYDSNKTFISGLSDDANAYNSVAFTTPNNAVYVRVCIKFYTQTIKSNFQFEQNTRCTTYEPFDGYISQHYLDTDYISSKINLNVTNFSVLKWNALGDSITNFGEYQTYVNNRLNLNVMRNYGVPGTNMADTTGSDSQAFVNRYSGMDNDAQVITVLGGTNDWGNSVLLGADGTYDKSTVKGAVRTIIEGLLTKYPSAYIVWMIMPYRIDASAWGGAHPGQNNNGDTLANFADAIITICKQYGIPYIDLLRESGWNSLNYASWLRDGVHPSNPAGMQRIASLLVNQFRKIVY
jgi:hypothetical protein